jgi:hypothetical protein
VGLICSVSRQFEFLTVFGLLAFRLTNMKRAKERDRKLLLFTAQKMARRSSRRAKS